MHTEIAYMHAQACSSELLSQASHILKVVLRWGVSKVEDIAA